VEFEQLFSTVAADHHEDGASGSQMPKGVLGFDGSSYRMGVDLPQDVARLYAGTRRGAATLHVSHERVAGRRILESQTETHRPLEGSMEITYGRRCQRLHADVERACVPVANHDDAGT
jgi:hypothetical protein